MAGPAGLPLRREKLAARPGRRPPPLAAWSAKGSSAAAAPWRRAATPRRRRRPPPPPPGRGATRAIDLPEQPHDEARCMESDAKIMMGDGEGKRVGKGSNAFIKQLYQHCLLARPLHRGGARLRSARRAHHLVFAPSNSMTSAARIFWLQHISCRASAWCSLSQRTVLRRRTRNSAQWALKSEQPRAKSNWGFSTHLPPQFQR